MIVDLFSFAVAIFPGQLPISHWPSLTLSSRCAPRLAAVDHASIIDGCLAGPVAAALQSDARDRVASYLQLLLKYNERTNVYSKSAYEKLPFHVQDSLKLAEILSKVVSTPGGSSGGGILDVGSGSGLPSLIVACVLPETPVFAIESKSRKTRFLQLAAREIGLEHYCPLTCNVHEFSRSWAFEVDAVTAKAFKPLPEVEPIARRCISSSARLLVPISEAQVQEFALDEAQLIREGQFLYFSSTLQPSHGAAQRKLCRVDTAPR
jgi:16S rRNA (guanine527-N7)-methyltransferase